MRSAFVGAWVGVFLFSGAPGDTELISQIEDAPRPSRDPNDSSGSGSLSGDGRYLAFQSGASNFVPDDTNGAFAVVNSDIFVYDRLLATTVRVSVSSLGEQGDSWSADASISSDGRYVAFTSYATNLVDGDTNDSGDVFVHDRLTGTTGRVSLDQNGMQAASGGVRPSINADGRYVAFMSPGSLIPGGTSTWEVFVRDRANGTTERISGGQSGDPSISADGRYVAFDSDATNLVLEDRNDASDVFVRDRATGILTRVSVTSGGEEGSGDSERPSISGDGRYVAFASTATNLVDGDTNDLGDVFVHDRLTGTTERVSLDESGMQGAGGARSASISADGRYVAFASDAALVSGDVNECPDVFLRDRTANTTQRVSVGADALHGSCNASPGSISGDGRYVPFQSLSANLAENDRNGLTDMFIHDVAVASTVRVETEPYLVYAGNQESNIGSSSVVSADGRYVVFHSGASDLVAGDTNGVIDIFVRDRLFETVRRVNVDSFGAQSDGGNNFASISSDGRYVVFDSTATTLVRGDKNGRVRDVFVHDLATRVTTLVSVDSAGVQGEGDSSQASISADGRYVAFQSASALVADDTNGRFDIFVRDRKTRRTERVSFDTSGAQRVDNSFGPSMSSDGRSIAFSSAVPDPPGLGSDFRAFVHDRLKRATDLVGVNSAGVPANSETFSPSLSGSGRFVAFVSLATNLGAPPTDDPTARNVYIRDRYTGVTEFVVADSGGPSLSVDGRYVAFFSDDDNLVANDTNGFGDIFVRDRVTRVTVRANVAAGGIEANDWSYHGPSIAPHGQSVAFASMATNLSPATPDLNGDPDVYLHKLLLPAAAFEQAPGAELAMEAEHYDESHRGGWVDHWEIVAFRSASNLEAVKAAAGWKTPNFAAPHLDYNVALVQTGHYRVWVRVRAFGPNSGSFAIALDDGPAHPGSIHGPPKAWSDQWVWARVAGALTVHNAGVHVVHLYRRAPDVAIDKIVLTQDPAFVPTDEGPPEAVRR